MNDIKIYTSQPYGRIGINLFITAYNQGRRKVLRPDFQTWVDEEPVGSAQTPTVYLHPEIHEALVKFIFDTQRPANSTFVEGNLEATKKHLEDMRKLVFNKNDTDTREN